MLLSESPIDNAIPKLEERENKDGRKLYQTQTKTKTLLGDFTNIKKTF